jgi:hypothetical protein
MVKGTIDNLSQNLGCYQMVYYRVIYSLSRLKCSVQVYSSIILKQSSLHYSLQILNLARVREEERSEMGKIRDVSGQSNLRVLACT